MKIIMKNIGILKATFLIVLFLIVAIIPMQGQEIYIPDHVVKNQLNNFFIEVENMMNENEGFDESNPSYILDKYFFNNDAGLYNDLDNSREYLSWDSYRKLANERTKKCMIQFAFYNLSLDKRNHYTYYDVIIASLIKETKSACGDANEFTSKTRPIEVTLIYNKYRTDDTKPSFQILKIDLQDKSYLPDAWYKRGIPDELFVEFSPELSIPSIEQSQNELDYKTKMGYQTHLGASWLIAGGNRDIFNLQVGVGYTKSIIDFDLESYNDAFDTTDADGDNYSREVYGNNINQTLEYATLDVPVMINWRHIFSKKLQLSVSTGINLSYIINQTYKTNGGTLEYRGLYSDLYGEAFYFQDLPSYGFTTYKSGNTLQDPNLNEFLISWKSSVYADIKLSNHITAFIGPNFNMGLNTLLDSPDKNFVLSPSEGNTKPLINLAQSIKVNHLGLGFGVRFSLNNINKAFNPAPKFKGHKQNQKLNRENYIEAMFPSKDKLSFLDASPSKKIIKKIKVKPVINAEKSEVAYVPKAILTNYKDLYISSPFTRFFRTNHYQSIKVPNELEEGGVPSNLYKGKGLFMLKPYGYNVNLQAGGKGFKVNDSLLQIPLESGLFNSGEVNLVFTPLPPLNIFIYNINDKAYDKLADNKQAVYDKYFEIAKGLQDNYGNETCLTFFWNEDVKANSEDSSDEKCLPCSEDLKKSQEKLAMLTDKDDPEDLYQDLKNQLGQQLAPERRTIKLNFLIADIAYLRDLLQGGLDRLIREMDPKQEAIKEVNFYFDYSDLNKLDYIPGIEEPVKYVEEIKRLQNSGLKSIQLKNLNFYPL